MTVSMKSSGSQRGVGMIEVMVAMLLLGIAVIGFAALQVRAVAMTGESSFRMQAMGLAQEFSEKVRANYGQLAAYRTSANWSTGTFTDCAVSACTAAQLATYDIQTTIQQAAAVLPGGTVAARQCNGSSTMCIYVAWNRTTTGSTGQPTDCVTAAGVYNGLSADCVMMEVYL